MRLLKGVSIADALSEHKVERMTHNLPAGVRAAGSVGTRSANLSPCPDRPAVDDLFSQIDEDHFMQVDGGADVVGNDLYPLARLQSQVRRKLQVPVLLIHGYKLDLRQIPDQPMSAIASRS